MAEINDEDIVISGISGRFPMSQNVDEWADNLYAKVNSELLIDLLLNIIQ